MLTKIQVTFDVAEERSVRGMNEYLLTAEGTACRRNRTDMLVEFMFPGCPIAGEALVSTFQNIFKQKVA